MKPLTITNQNITREVLLSLAEKIEGAWVREALEQYSNIHLEYLPPYHPELNPQERIWKLIRYEVTTNRYFPDVEAINMAIRKKQRQIKKNKIRLTCVGITGEDMIKGRGS